MKRISFETSDVAATPKHDLGEFHLIVPDVEVDVKVEALVTLGFTPRITDVMLTFETLDFYRPWCRYCGRKEGPCVIADDQPWVEDEDDIGFPICVPCTRKGLALVGG